MSELDNFQIKQAQVVVQQIERVVIDCSPERRDFANRVSEICSKEYSEECLNTHLTRRIINIFLLKFQGCKNSANAVTQTRLYFGIS